MAVAVGLQPANTPPFGGWSPLCRNIAGPERHELTVPGDLAGLTFQLKS